MDAGDEADLLARLWQFGASMAVASDCKTQALSGFMDSVAALRVWVERGGEKNPVHMHPMMLDVDRHLRVKMADSLRFLLLSNSTQGQLVQASRSSTVSISRYVESVSTLCCVVCFAA